MKSEVEVLETDVVLFPAKGEEVLEEQKSINVKVEKRTIKIDVKERFVRLRKSMRKRSVSIL